MHRFLLIVSCIALLFFACNNSRNLSNKIPDSINLEIRMLDTLSSLDTLRLFAWESIQAEEILKTPFKKSSAGLVANFKLGKMPKGMYYVGTSLSDLKPMLLGTEATVIFSTKEATLASLSPEKSDLNKSFDQLMQRVQSSNQVFMSLMTEYNAAKGDKDKKDVVASKMAKEDLSKRKLLDSLKAADSELTRIMAFNAFQSYQNNAADGQTEGAYFTKAFFEFVDFKDTTYARLPFYFENVKNYTTALAQVGISVQLQNAALDSLFAAVTDTCPNYKPTLVAVMFGTMNKNNAAFTKYGKIYVEKYAGSYPVLDKFVKDKLVELRGAAGVGEEAINLVGNTPEGTSMDLKSLRGKYVLIDFWASWCGPCRRENPNVVRLYNKYKDKGFDILGVSLDNNKAKWEAAIEKDQLSWHHISDLKGWSSALAKPYGVRGIPYTVLVDKEGKIIAKKLRGAALEAKLKEIFGS